jgi:hypothetical protein
MKKNILIFILVALLTAVAALLSSCESATAAESMSLKPSAEMESSSSMDELSSSSMEELSSSSAGNSSSSSPIYAYYYGETGKVCKAWVAQGVPASQAYNEYSAMYATCGNQKIRDNLSKLGEVIFLWLLNGAGIDESTAVKVSNDVEQYGSSLQFYKVDDGSLNYIYVKPFWDDAGMK